MIQDKVVWIGPTVKEGEAVNILRLGDAWYGNILTYSNRDAENIAKQARFVW